MRRYFVTPVFLLFAVSMVTFAAGCGENKQEYVSEATVTMSQKEIIKNWLESVAKSGQLDSSILTIRDEVKKLEQEPGVDTAGLLAGIDELEKLRSPAAVQKKAGEMLKLLNP